MKRFVFTILALLIFGCSASLPQRISKLEIEIPEQWTVKSTEPGIIPGKWWEGFNDPQLPQIIDQMLKHNYDLKVAAANVRSAVAEARIAGADIYPQVSAGLSGSRRKVNYIGFPIPGAEDKVLSSVSNTFGISLDVSWEPDLWGRISSGERATISNLQASRADLAGAKLSLIAQTAKVWFTAVEMQRQLQLTRSSLDSYQKTLKYTSERYRKGLSYSTDLRLATSSAAMAQILVRQWQEQYDNIIRQLKILMGDYPAGQLKLTEQLCILPGQVPAGLPSDLISRRPDLVAAELRLLASTELIAQARANLYPRFSLTGRGGTSSNELKDLLDGDFNVWSMVGNLIQPLFQGGKIRAGVDLAKARREQALAFYASSVLQAYAEVESALQAEIYLTQQTREITLVYEQARGLYKATLKRYQSGLVNSLALLQTERSALEAESRLITIRRQQLGSRINLYLALGGGFRKDMIQNK